MTLRGMIVTVGGSPDPIVFSINGDKPEVILFIVSDDSRSQVEGQIIPCLQYIPQYECLTISDHENIEACYKEMREGITEWLGRRQLNHDDARVDYTGGTKPMSAALALASVERFGDFKYIASYQRAKDGLGQGVSGYEHHARNQNPWNTLAVRELERANWLLSEFHAETAADVLTEAASKCDESHSGRLKTLALLAESLAAADRFQFRDAVSKLGGGKMDPLEYVLQDYSTFQQLKSLHRHWNCVRQQINAENITPGRETLLELLANAERRAKQSRYDDATGRLYRAVELYGQQLVKKAFAAEIGKPYLTDFPADRREKVLEEFGEPDDKRRYKLGVQKLFQALEFSDDANLRDHARLYAPLKKHLQKRNNSLLAHGLRPVSQDDFHKLWAATLEALHISESDIPRWPTLELSL